MNIQKVTKGGWELYLAKYVAKAEPSFDLKLPETASESERYIRTRVAGRLEIDFTLLGCQLSRGTKEVVFLPTEFDPKVSYLKRPQHLTQQRSSKDIFYDTRFQKYLDRPDKLQNVTYPDFCRQYRYNMQDTTSNEQDSDDDTECIQQSGKGLQDKKGRKIIKRPKGKEAIPRWRFLVPFGNDQESFYEQKLILNIPFTSATAKSVISESNTSKTYTEECAIRDLLDKPDDSIAVLQLAEKQGYSLKRLKEIAHNLTSSGWMETANADIFLTEVSERRPLEFNLEQQQEVGDDQSEEDNLDNLMPRKMEINLSEMKTNFSDSQAKAFNWIEHQVTQGQTLACVVGQAGTGKSYLINAVVQMVKAHGMCAQKLATTGVAAYLIEGETVHHFFKMDVECHSYLEMGTAEFAVVKTIDILIIDEFSLLERKVFYTIDRLCRQIECSKKSRLPFGGKHIILVGDPAQLPAIDEDIFMSPLFKQFAVLLLKTVKRQDDKMFLQVLDNVRLGSLTQSDSDVLKTRLVGASDIDNITPPVIVSLRVERDHWNKVFLDKLQAEEVTFEAIDTDREGHPISEHEAQMIKKYQRQRLPDALHLKIGATVIVLKNINTDEGWVNGTLATVLSIKPTYITLKHKETGKSTIVPRMRQTLGSKLDPQSIIRQQFPLQLGWALTVHKVQGTTLNQATVLLNNTFFASGQAYVALSRVKKLDNLHLLSFCEKAIFLDPFYQDLLKWMNSADVLEKNVKLPYPIRETNRKRVRVDEEKCQTKEDICTKKPNKDASGTDRSSASKTEMKKTERTCAQQELDLSYARRTMTGKTAMTPAQPEIRTTYQDLSQREPIFQTQIQLPQANTRIISSIHPVFLKHHQFVDTPAAGNCLFNSISIGLSGTPALSTELRILAATTIQLHEEYFKKIIDEFGLTNQTYQEAVRTALHEGAWGGEYHLQALAMALNRPIYIYTSFKQSNGQWFVDSTDDEGLLQAFQNEVGGTGQHLVYMPIPNTDNEPLMCFFMEYHYTAVVKRTPSSITFKPHMNLFTRRIRTT